MKVTIRIHKDDGSVDFKTKKVNDDGTVLLRKKTKWQKEWKPVIKWKEDKHLLFNRAKYFTDIFPEAKETFQINAHDENIKRPELDQKEITRYAKSKVFEKRYMTEQKPISSSILYILLIVQIITLVLMFLLNTGRLKL